MQRMRVLLLALALALPLLAAAAPDPGAFGPMRIGMTLSQAAEVRARAPLVNAGQVVGYSVDKAYRIDGVQYDVGLRPQASGASEIELTSRAWRVTLEACRQDAQSLVAEMDKRFGPLAVLEVTRPPLNPRAVSDRALADLARGRPVWLTGFREIFGPAATPAAAIRLGRSEVAEVVEAATTRWTTGRRAGGESRYDVLVEAAFLPANQSLYSSSPECRLSAVIRYSPADYVKVHWATLQPGPALSQGDAYHSLQGARLPERPVTARIICRVPGGGQGLRDCIADGDTPASMVSAAMARLKAPAASPDGDRLDARLLLGRGSVVLDPADYPALTVEQARAATLSDIPASGPSWIRQPSQSLLERIYPERALRLELESKVTAICQIQRDGSLACPVVESTAADVGFEAAAVKLLSEMRVAPSLPDGSASAGKWVKKVLPFRIG